jgi:3-methyl-2-oxobutanoate hydroxymethyltransferase
MVDAGEKIAMLTCYDASFSALMNECGVDILLVGDSLGMVCQGHTTTLPVTVGDVAYHVRSVARANSRAVLMADLPFGTYATPAQAFESAAELVRAGAHLVKLEGGAWLGETVRFLSERGIPVCAHLGLTPQYVHQLGGYRVQGRQDEAARSMMAAALALQSAGAAMLLFELVPADLGTALTAAVEIPTIGIGAGAGCDGQVLVSYDALGIYPGKKARFVKNFMAGQADVHAAVRAYVQAVKNGSFPAPEHCF